MNQITYSADKAAELFGVGSDRKVFQFLREEELIDSINLPSTKARVHGLLVAHEHHIENIKQMRYTSHFTRKGIDVLKAPYRAWYEKKHANKKTYSGTGPEVLEKLKRSLPQMKGKLQITVVQS